MTLPWELSASGTGRKEPLSAQAQAAWRWLAQGKTMGKEPGA